MGQSPKGDEVNSCGKGVPLLNGPTEFTDRYPEPVQFTENGRRFAEKGDILFCVRGSTTGRMNYADQKYAIGRGIGAIRGNNGFPTPYVRAVIEQNLDRLLQAATGSTFPNVSRDTLNNFEVSSVGREVAIRINQFIVSLEDKVYLNSQINRTLEQMAQAIFKSWFVDFEPVKAKIAALEAGGSEEDALLAAMQAISGTSLFDADASAAGAQAALTRLQAEQPEQYAELCATAELFPSAMQDSELGEIPEGWGVGAFKDLCLRVESGGTPKRSEPNYWGDDIKWLSSGEVRDVIAFETKEKITHSGLKNSSAKLWPIYTTVVAMYGATAGQVCLLADEMTSNQACCGLIPKEHHRSFMFISARNSISSLADKASGSAQQNLNKALVSNHISLLPPDSILALYESIALPLLDAWIQNSLQNKKLGEVRDALLPKLLSGELCVSAVDDHLATVAEAANV